MVELRHSEVADLSEIAKCHMRVFPDALASCQGVGFVSKMLQWYLMSERGVLLQLTADGQIVGYCGGIKIYEPGLPGAFTSISQYAFWAFVKSTLRKPWLVAHRENLKRHRMVIRNIMIRLRLRKPMTKVSESEIQKFKTSWGLVVIGVDPTSQKKGFGSKLLAEFERLAQEDEVECIRLSVKLTNKQAIASYRRNGWRESDYNGDSIQMIKNINLPNHNSEETSNGILVKQ